MLQFGKPTIDDLANAEIAYAPPFASAMDAVNAVANVADNILSGQLKPISSKEFGELWKDRANNNVFFADARPPWPATPPPPSIPANGTPSRWKTLKRSSTPSPKIAWWPLVQHRPALLRSDAVPAQPRRDRRGELSLGGMQALIKRGDNM